MIKTKVSVEIGRPVPEVFAFVTQVENFPKWFGEIVRESHLTTSGSISVGTKFTQVNEFLGRRFQTHFTVTEYQPDRLFCVATTFGPIPFQGCFSFEPVEGGTLFTDRHQIGRAGFFDLVGSLLVARLRRQAEVNLSNLKRIVESQPESQIRVQIAGE